MKTNSMFKQGFVMVGIVAFPGSLTSIAHADVITDWNQQLLNSISAGNVAPPRAARMMAMVHTAQFDAVNAISNQYQTYQGYLPCPSGASKEAAAAQAARDVLTQFFPTRQAIFDAQLTTHLNAVGAGQGRTDGVDLGGRAATGIMNLRSSDNSNNNFTYNGGTNPGQWRPTGPGFASAALPHWGTVTPFSVNSSSQYMPSAPPSINSPAYATAYNEVRELGRNTSATRTQQQTDTAFLWRAGSNTVTPPGMWNEIAQQVVSTNNLSIEESARTFALLGIAVSDAAITAWKTKNTYDFWRPETAIILSGSDGFDPAGADPTWQPLLVTPNHQSYTSGHSTFSSAAAAVLAELMGDTQTFTVTGDGITRQYTSISAAMEDAGMSRIYGGIHWQFDNQAGLDSGSAIGEWVVENSLRVPTPGAIALLGMGGLMIARRRRSV